MSIDRSNVILRGVVGSTAYGLDHEGSDVDRLGVYVAPIDVVLGLNGSSLDDPQSKQTVDDTLVQHAPDLTLHEVGKYVSLALQCNPTILELLWLPEHEVRTHLGQLLVEHRQDFLSTDRVKGRYGGYAKAQAERLMRRNAEGKEGFSSDVGNRTAKDGRHVARLLIQGQQLLNTGEMQVKVSSSHREYIFEMGDLAEQDPERFYVRFQDSLEDLYETESVLPDQNNREAINRMLIQIRMTAMAPDWELMAAGVYL